MSRKLILEAKQPLGGAEKEPPVTYRLYEAEGSIHEVFLGGMQGFALVGTTIKINCYSRGTAPPAKSGETEERDVVLLPRLRRAVQRRQCVKSATERSRTWR